MPLAALKKKSAPSKPALKPKPTPAPPVLAAPARMQAKLEVGPASDRFEQEADRTADSVMRMPSPAMPIAAAPLQVSRKCAVCEREEKDDKRLQKKSAGLAEANMGEAPASVHAALRSPGQPLDKASRAYFEPRFGQEFGDVRVHTGMVAAQSARDVSAHAYTVGQNIVFAAGRFAPATQTGRRLIAHELTHVIQQGEKKAALRRAPDPRLSQAAEARLRVNIVDGLEARKTSAVDALEKALERGDRAYLEGLGLSSKQIQHLLNRTPQFEMIFGTAAELAVERAVRADPFLSQYIKRGPMGHVPRGVGKPDWVIETPSSRIPVDLMTPEQVEKKLEMWRRQWRRGKPKWYVEKGLNTTYKRSKPKRTSPMDVHEGGMPKRTSPMDVHEGGMPKRTSPMDVHEGGMPKRTSPMDVHEGGMPKRTSPMDVHEGGMPKRTSPMDVHQGGMPEPTSPIEVPHGGIPEPALAPEVPGGALARVRAGVTGAKVAFKAGMKAGLKSALSPEGIASLIPDLVLAVADKVAFQEAIRTIEIKFMKEGFAKGVAAGVVGWSKEEVGLNLKNRVTPFRVQGLEDPAGFLTSSNIFRIAEAYENYAVDVGYQFSSQKTLAWKNALITKGFKVLADRGYHFGDDPQALFEYGFIDKLGWVLHPTTDPMVEAAIKTSEEKHERAKRETREIGMKI